MAAITVNITDPGAGAVDYMGSRKIVYGNITFSNSYLTGGDTFTAGQFSLEALTWLDVSAPTNATPVALIPVPVLPTNTGFNAAGTIQLYWAAAANTAFTQVANTTNTVAYTCKFRAEGW